MRGHRLVVHLRLRSPFRLLRHQPLVPARASWPSALRKKAFGYSEDLEQLHGITDTSNEMGAFMVVRADSHEDAAKLVREASTLHDLSGRIRGGYAGSADSPGSQSLRRISQARSQKFRKLSSSASAIAAESPGIGMARRRAIAGGIFGRSRGAGTSGGLTVAELPPTSWRSFAT